MEQKGLSPMVATIVLIAMVMIIAGVLAAGLTGTAPDEPRDSGVDVEGIGPDSDQLELKMQAGKTYNESFWLEYDNENNKAYVNWNQLELRIAGETVSGNVLKATEDGQALLKTNENGSNPAETYIPEDALGEWENTSGDNYYVTADNSDFYLGDMLRIDTLNPVMTSGDSVTVIWVPDDQSLFVDEV